MDVAVVDKNKSYHPDPVHVFPPLLNIFHSLKCSPGFNFQRLFTPATKYPSYWFISVSIGPPNVGIVGIVLTFLKTNHTFLPMWGLEPDGLGVVSIYFFIYYLKVIIDLTIIINPYGRSTHMITIEKLAYSTIIHTHPEQMLCWYAVLYIFSSDINGFNYLFFTTWYDITFLFHHMIGN